MRKDVNYHQMSLLVGFILFVVAVGLIHRLSARRRKFLLPPGPRKLPLIGNTLSMPSHHPWVTFAEWGRQWGDIISVSVLGQNLIILNSIDTAVELLDGRGQIYSDRPIVPFAGELVGWSRTLGLTPYGERFRTHRRYLHKVIGSHSSVAKFSETIEREVQHFVEHILLSPDDLDSSIKKAIGAIVLEIAYGYKVEVNNDPLVILVESAMKQLGFSVNPSEYLVNIIPALCYLPSWLPGAHFKKTAKEWRKTMEEMAEVPYAFVKQNLALGTAQPSFTSTLLEEHGIGSTREWDIKWIAASFYAGGSDTTKAGINAFFLSMTLHPNVILKAQQEIDTVVGPERLPVLQDQAHLPYVNAVIKEVLRWHAIVPTGVPHRVTEDDHYRGYFIPKGSMVFSNTWNMARNPDTYVNPEEFNPERFLGPNPERDPADFVFGFGRRKCPGRILADATMFVFIANVLSMCNISASQDHDIEIPLMHEQVSEGPVSHPCPLQCTVSPRVSNASNIIKSNRT